MVIFVTMKQQPTMTQLLRKALQEAGSLYPVEEATGVTRQSMMKFLRGTSLRLDIADRLAAYFGIQSRVIPKPRTEGKAKHGTP